MQAKAMEPMRKKVGILAKSIPCTLIWKRIEIRAIKSCSTAKLFTFGSKLIKADENPASEM